MTYTYEITPSSYEEDRGLHGYPSWDGEVFLVGPSILGVQPRPQSIFTVRLDGCSTEKEARAELFYSFATRLRQQLRSPE